MTICTSLKIDPKKNPKLIKKNHKSYPMNSSMESKDVKGFL